MRIILFLLVAIRLFNVRLYFPVMTGKMQSANFYCDPIKMVCFPNIQLVTIFKLGKNKFI